MVTLPLHDVAKASKPAGGALFLPQLPYMPLEPTLRRQLLWPSGEAGGGVGGAGEDRRLHRALAAVRLETVLERVGGLDTPVHDWTTQLSLGEQQRLALARLLIQRPALAFLDEASSGLDLATERSIYQALRGGIDPLAAEGGPPATSMTVVSVGHRIDTLLPWHTHVLAADGGVGGRWKFLSAAEFKQLTESQLAEV